MEQAMHYKTVRNLWINMNFDNMRKKVKDKHKITNVKMYIKSICENLLHVPKINTNMSVLLKIIEVLMLNQYFGMYGYK